MFNCLIFYVEIPQISITEFKVFFHQLDTHNFPIYFDKYQNHAYEYNPK